MILKPQPVLVIQYFLIVDSAMMAFLHNHLSLWR